MDNLIDEAQLVVQHRKDQFRVEIRKKKTDSLFQQMRGKLFENREDSFVNSGSEQNVDNQITISSTLEIENLEKSLIQSIDQADENGITIILLNIVTQIGKKTITINQVFETQLPITILGILSKGVRQQKIYGTIILSSLSLGTNEQLKPLFEHNLIPALLELIQTGDAELAEHSIFLLNNVLILNLMPENLVGIFQINPKIIESVCYYFTVPPWEKEGQQTLNLLKAVIRLIFILSKIVCINQNYYQSCRICIPYLVWILDHYHPKGPSTSQATRFNVPSKGQNSTRFPKQELYFCIRTIADLSKGHMLVVSDLTKSQVDKVVIRYLEQGVDLSQEFLAALVRIVGQISSGSDYQNSLLLQQGIYSHLKRLSTHAHEQIRKESIWAISNFSAGNQKQIQVYLDNGMTHFLIDLLKKERNYEIRKEILVALTNPTEQASKQQVQCMLSAGLLPVLAENITTDLQQSMMIQLLEGLENILNSGTSHALQEIQSPNFLRSIEDCGVLNKIQEIFYLESSCEEVVKLAHRIIQLSSKLC